MRAPLEDCRGTDFPCDGRVLDCDYHRGYKDGYKRQAQEEGSLEYVEGWVDGMDDKYDEEKGE